MPFIVSAPLTRSPTAHTTPYERVLKYEIRRQVTCEEHPQFLNLQQRASCSHMSDALSADLGLTAAEPLAKDGD